MLNFEKSSRTPLDLAPPEKEGVPHSSNHKGKEEIRAMLNAAMQGTVRYYASFPKILLMWNESSSHL
jgi:hypothetical protein